MAHEANQPTPRTIYKSTLEENQRSQIGTLFNVATPYYFGPSNLFRPKPKTGKNEITTTSTKAKTLSISFRSSQIATSPASRETKPTIKFPVFLSDVVLAFP
ncbi:hypothetical protein V8G54_009352 [Vigna mungo]|uniref:Uncharacterized protein n=1 Tax=Vigna mungo TaxID=3915 RepID=A0AAQ3NV13_VIGMU